MIAPAQSSGLTVARSTQRLSSLRSGYQPSAELGFQEQQNFGLQQNQYSYFPSNNWGTTDFGPYVSGALPVNSASQNTDMNGTNGWSQDTRTGYDPYSQFSLSVKKYIHDSYASLTGKIERTQKNAYFGASDVTEWDNSALDVEVLRKELVDKNNPAVNKSIAGLSMLLCPAESNIFKNEQGTKPVEWTEENCHEAGNHVSASQAVPEIHLDTTSYPSAVDNLDIASTESNADSQNLAVSSPQEQESNCIPHFDPRVPFKDDDLRPQPLKRKAKKVPVSEECKDSKYWNRRYKNNVAARRSREAKRIKENQIAMRASFLENENASLKIEVKKLRKELKRAMDHLKKFEAYQMPDS